MKAIVRVHDEWPPHRMIIDLDGVQVDRVLTRTGRGAFAFTVVNRELHREAIKEGRIVVIESSENITPYVGVITQIAEDAASGVVELSGDNYASVLYNVALDQNIPASNQDAGKIAAGLLKLAQGSGRPLFIREGEVHGTPLLTAGTVEVGGQSLGDAFDALCERTGDEWWLEHLVSRVTIQTFLYWGRRGTDNSSWAYLEEGRDFSRAAYKRDGLGAVRSVIAVGGGGPLGSRKSVAVSRQAGASVATATRVQATTDPLLSPLVARDVFDIRPRDDDPTVLAEAALRGYNRPLTAQESLALTITSRQWSILNPGDTVTCRFHSLNQGGLIRAIRIDAMQPDEATGECDLEVSV